MCVAVCAREIDSRRSRSTSECASSPGVTSPLSTVAWCTISPLIGACTSSTRSRAPLESSMIAVVGQLPAALGVERRPVEDQLDLVALADAVDHPVGGDQPAHRAVADHLGVPGELHRRAHGVRDGAVGRGVAVRALLGPGVRLGPVALLLHQPAEADLVDVQPLLGRHLEGEVDREAERVVQRERPLRGQLAAAGLLHLGGRGVEDRGARAQRLPERAPPRRTPPSRSAPSRGSARRRSHPSCRG